MGGDPRRLEPGAYLVDAACPRCGAIEEVLAQLATVLTVPSDDTGTLRVKLKAKARDHDCRQARLLPASFTVEQHLPDGT